MGVMIRSFPPHPNPLPQRLCRKGENGKNVMLNLFQHLIKSNGYETLKRVQGDKKTITTQSPKGEGSHSSPQRSWGVSWHSLMKTFLAPFRHQRKKGILWEKISY